MRVLPRGLSDLPSGEAEVQSSEMATRQSDSPGQLRIKQSFPAAFSSVWHHGSVLTATNRKIRFTPLGVYSEYEIYKTAEAVRWRSFELQFAFPRRPEKIGKIPQKVGRLSQDCFAGM